jgi:hypothetical protein
LHTTAINNIISHTPPSQADGLDALEKLQSHSNTAVYDKAIA